MTKLYMMKGLPASGKTTIARKLAAETGAKIVNRDSLREMLDLGVYSDENEDFVRTVRDDIVRLALMSGHDIIVDDTNLNPEVQDHLQHIADAAGAELLIVWVAAPLLECLDRDAWREKQVGVKVIIDLYMRFVANEP